MGANLSQRSRDRLATCHPDIIAVIMEVERVSPLDFTVLQGHRTPEEQFNLFKQGRRLVGGSWIVEDKTQVVTYIDGFDKVGQHNFTPSRAVDLAPYPVDWMDKARFFYLAGIVLGVAGRMNIPLTWGGDWDGDGDFKDHGFTDLPHFELKP